MSLAQLRWSSSIFTFSGSDLKDPGSDRKSSKLTVWGGRGTQIYGEMILWTSASGRFGNQSREWLRELLREWGFAWIRSWVQWWDLLREWPGILRVAPRMAFSLWERFFSRLGCFPSFWRKECLSHRVEAIFEASKYIQRSVVEAWKLDVPWQRVF